jgi:hypothetical protein
VLALAACSAPSSDEDTGPIEVLPPDSAQDLSLAFDGSDDYASTGTAGFPFARLPQTVSFWLKAAASGGTEQTVITLRKDAESGVRVGLCGGALCAKSIYSRNVFAQATTPLPAGEWHHVAYQFDGSDDAPHHTIYLDGVSVATGTAIPEKRTPTSGFLGSTDGSELFFSGELDELRIWSVARNAQQIAAEIAGQAPEQEPPDLIAYYTFNELGGARVIDRSGRGNHALLGDGVSSRMPRRVLSGFAAGRP